MNERTRNITEKIADVVKTFPLITEAVVIGSATDNDFSFDENIMLAVYTKPEANIATTCVELNNAFGDKNLYNIDIYMMADNDFYLEVHDLIDSGEVIFKR